MRVRRKEKCRAKERERERDQQLPIIYLKMVDLAF